MNNKYLDQIEVNCFARIISTDCDDLMQIINSNKLPFEQLIYAKVLIAFLKYSNEELESLVKFLDSFSLIDKNIDSTLAYELNAVRNLSLARLMIRSKKIDFTIFNLLEKSYFSNGVYNGEISFITAVLYSDLKEYKKSIDFYKRAMIDFENEGIPKKALKCLANAIACESKISKIQNFTPQYEYIVRKAIELEEYIIAGTNLNNISYEYQLSGAYFAALNFNQKSINILEKHANLTINYYFSLMQNIDILISLKRYDEAILNYEKCILAPFNEVNEGLKVIKGKLERSLNSTNKKENEIMHDLLSRQWQIKQIESNKQDKGKSILSQSEEQIVILLLEKPLTRSELGRRIHGEKIDPTIIDNRIKVTLSNIKRKKPGLISVNNNIYSVSVNLYPEIRKK